MLTEFAKSEAGDEKEFIESLQRKLEREKKKKDKASKSSASRLHARTSVVKRARGSSKKS